MDATWVRIYPYQMVIAAGDSAPAQVRVHNYRSTPMKMEVALVLPSGWRTEPEVLRFEVPPKGRVSCPFRLFTTRDGPALTPRLAITADVTADGKRLGQITEAVVNLRA
jgi:hypothetical protein